MAKKKNDPTPEAPAVSASALAPEGDDSALLDADEAHPPAPEAPAIPASVPNTHVLATWTGLGRFSGVLYTLEGKERPFCIGVTVGYFPLASVLKMREQFQRPDDASPGPAMIAPAAGPVPEGHVLARWKGPGRFSGRHFTFPAREERVQCIGATTAYFDAASVKKLAVHFEML